MKTSGKRARLANGRQGWERWERALSAAWTVGESARVVE